LTNQGFFVKKAQHFCSVQRDAAFTKGPDDQAALSKISHLLFLQLLLWDAGDPLRAGRPLRLASLRRAAVLRVLHEQSRDLHR